jgi:hypothetical protein
MPPDRPALTEDEVIASGAWHPRYARVLAMAGDGDYGLAIVGGNGDGAELEAETWEWDGERWTGSGSAGVGPSITSAPRRPAGRSATATTPTERARPMRSWLAPAPSTRTRMARRNRAGTCFSAAASTSLWSVNVFDPALPGRSSMFRHSRVFAHQAASGWS